MSDLQVLLQGIQSGNLLGSEIFDQLDIEETLAQRSEAHFEQKWLRFFDLIETKNFEDPESALVNRIREVAFKAVFNGSSDPDLAGYISDDFEIIAKGILTERENSFLAALLNTYLQGEIPTGRTIRSGPSVDSLMQTLRQQI